MRRMFIAVIAPLLIFMAACSGTTNEEKAAKAAKGYYDLLVEGDVVRFLENKAGIDSLSSDYGEQLLVAVRRYQHDVQEKHGGLRQVYISDNPARSDTVHGQLMVYAFLNLCYTDSTQEEVVVPMVEQGDQWLMK